MATIDCTVTRSSWYRVYFEYSYVQDITNAKTTLTHALKLEQLTNGYDFDTVSPATIEYYVAGTRFYKTARINIDDKGNKGYTITLASGTSVIQHNTSTGVGSFAVSVNESLDSAGWGPGTITLSTTVSLPTIPRVSVPTLSASTVKMNDVLTITTNRASTDFTHTLKYTIGSTTVTMATGVGASYKWTVPDLAKNINNATSTTMVITCITYNGSTTVGTKTVSFTVKVPDATVPSFPNGDVIIGTSNPITTSAGSTNFSHIITYSFHGKTGNVNDEKVKSGIVWWTPYALASAIPNDTDGEGTITCTTYNGTAVVGSKTVPFTGIVPDNSTTKPTFTEDNFVLTPTGNIPSTFSGLYIQGKTGVKASFTASSTYSTIASYKLSADGRVYTGNPAESQALTKDGNIEVTGTVYDARGYYTHRPKTITVHPYFNPSIEPYSGDSSIICERSDGSGVYSDAGTYLHIRAKRKYAPVIVDGAQKNICHLQYRYKAEGGNWSSPTTILSGSNTATDEIEVELTDVVTQTDKSYLVQLIVTDTMGASVPYDFPIGTDKVTFHLRKGGKGAAFGKYSEADNLLECDWNGQFNGSLFANHFGAIDLYNDKDFNNLIYNTGYYTGRQAPSVAGCSNYPNNTTGILEVISAMVINATTGNEWGFAFQTYRTHTGTIYTRSYMSDTGWTDWKTIT